MTEVSVSGLPVLALEVGFIVLAALPIWFGAKVVGAGKPTLGRAVASLVIGMIGCALMIAVAGVWGFLLAPLSFLVAFKYVLDTSMFGALVLGVLAVAGYFFLGKVVGSAVTVAPQATVIQDALMLWSAGLS